MTKPIERDLLGDPDLRRKPGEHGNGARRLARVTRDKLAARGQLPLDVMGSLMVHYLKAGNFDKATDLAVQMLPYCHPKLIQAVPLMPDGSSAPRFASEPGMPAGTAAALSATAAAGFVIGWEDAQQQQHAAQARADAGAIEVEAIER